MLFKRGHSYQGEDWDSGPPGEPWANLILENLKWQVDWRQLRELFQHTVKGVRYAKVALEPDGRSAGHGIVQYHLPQQAMEAMRQLQGYVLMGRPLHIRLGKQNMPTLQRQNPSAANGTMAQMGSNFTAAFQQGAYGQQGAFAAAVPGPMQGGFDDGAGGVIPVEFAQAFMQQAVESSGPMGAAFTPQGTAFPQGQQLAMAPGMAASGFAAGSANGQGFGRGQGAAHMRSDSNSFSSQRMLSSAMPMASCSAPQAHSTMLNGMAANGARASVFDRLGSHSGADMHAVGAARPHTADAGPQQPTAKRLKPTPQAAWRQLDVPSPAEGMVEEALQRAISEGGSAGAGDGSFRGMMRTTSGRMVNEQAPGSARGSEDAGPAPGADGHAAAWGRGSPDEPSAATDGAAAGGTWAGVDGSVPAVKQEGSDDGDAGADERFEHDMQAMLGMEEQHGQQEEVQDLYAGLHQQQAQDDACGQQEGRQQQQQQQQQQHMGQDSENIPYQHQHDAPCAQRPQQHEHPAHHEHHHQQQQHEQQQDERQQDGQQGTDGEPGRDYVMFGRRLAVGNLPTEATEEDLAAHFGTIGPVTILGLLTEPAAPKAGSQEPSTRAVVEYDTAGDALRAAFGLSNVCFRGRPLMLRLARDEDMPDDPAACQVLVQGLPLSYGEPQVQEFVEEAGTVVSITMFRDTINGAQVGCARVVFSSIAEAQGAVEQLDGFMIIKRRLTVRLDPTAVGDTGH